MRGGKMRLSTVSRAPEGVGANDAEAPEARILPCRAPAIASVSATRCAVASSPRAIRHRRRACYSHWSIIPFALWMSTR